MLIFIFHLLLVCESHFFGIKIELLDLDGDFLDF
jgi:hypothetical protein